MGGYSSEFEISILSGQTVMQALIEKGLDAVGVKILKGGWTVFDQGEEYSIDKRDFSYRDSEGRRHHFKAVFNAVHGHPGEDGTIQAYFDLLGIHYTSSGVFASAFTFNKAQCSAFANKLGISISPSITLRKGQSLNAKKLVEKLGLPLFVKPNRAGSSFGISKVKDIAELERAMEVAFAEDELIIFERAVKGIELACGVSDHSGKATVLGVTEIVPKNDFFDYESKYSGDSPEITPARISPKAMEKVEQDSLLLYRELELKGIARIDYILNEEDKPILIEVNSVPGLSPESIVPKQAKWSGISLSDLFSQNIERCLNE
jgi:D-alanine-D-alanine ligase